MGTVQDTTTPKTQIVAEPKGTISFAGVSEVSPISNDKFEVFFYPATGGSGRYNYIFYVGESLFPITVPSEVLLPDYRGLLKYTVTGLQTGKTYFVKVEAQDEVSGAKDVNTVTKSATTFINQVANFSGIGSVTNSSGVDGLDSIKVRWPHALLDYGNVSVGNAPSDPKYYEVVAIDSTLLSPGNMDDTSKGPSQGRFVKNIDYNVLENETVMRGLKSDVKYYVRVRAIHNGTQNDPNNPNLRGEKNTNILSIKTLNADLGAIKFDTKGLTVSRSTGSAQSNSVVLTWPVVAGVFDHMRIYYAQTQGEIANLDTSKCIIESTKGCKRVVATSVGTTVPNLVENKDYYFRMVICQLEICSTNIIGEIKEGSTRPVLASFTGVTGISAAKSVADIGKIFLTFALPNFNEGNFHGYHIAYRGSNEFQEPVVINLPTYTGTLRYESFDYLTATGIVITNVDYTLGTDYCFSVYPFVYDSDEPTGYKSYPNKVWKCVKAEILRPDQIQFPGLSIGSVTGNRIEVSWNAPTGGVFDNYQLYIKNTEGGFSFTTAKANGADYVRVQLPSDSSSYVFNLPTGSYRIGILTSYSFLPPSGESLIYYSEDNQNILVCDVIAGSVNPAACRNL